MIYICMCLYLHKETLKGQLTVSGCPMGSGKMGDSLDCTTINMFWLLNHVSVLPI